jgi:DNA polymerase-1
MTNMFEQDLDPHSITASWMADKVPADVTDEERRAAKAINFGAIYGIGAMGLVKSAWDNYGLVITEAEARRWLASFTAAYPKFARWRVEHAHKCEETQCIVIGKDMSRGCGRFFPKSRLKPNQSYYTRCCNLPVQGACADASMLALAAVDRALERERIAGGPVAWLHDEIVLEVAAADAPRAAELLREAMRWAFRETFPGAPLNGLVEPRIGLSWGETKP